MVVKSEIEENDKKRISANGDLKGIGNGKSLEEKYDLKKLTISLTKLPFEFDENGKPKSLNPSALKNYVVMYSDENPFQCSICSKEYKSRESFSCHIRTHVTGKKASSKNVFLGLSKPTGRVITRCMVCVGLISVLYYYSTDMITGYMELPSWFPLAT